MEEIHERVYYVEIQADADADADPPAREPFNAAELREACEQVAAATKRLDRLGLAGAAAGRKAAGKIPGGGREAGSSVRDNGATPAGVAQSNPARRLPGFRLFRKPVVRPLRPSPPRRPAPDARIEQMPAAPRGGGGAGAAGGGGGGAQEENAAARAHPPPPPGRAASVPAPPRTTAREGAGRFALPKSTGAAGAGESAPPAPDPGAKLDAPAPPSQSPAALVLIPLPGPKGPSAESRRQRRREAV